MIFSFANDQTLSPFDKIHGIRMADAIHLEAEGYRRSVSGLTTAACWPCECLDYIIETFVDTSLRSTGNDIGGFACLEANSAPAWRPFSKPFQAAANWLKGAVRLISSTL